MSENSDFDMSLEKRQSQISKNHFKSIVAGSFVFSLMATYSGLSEALFRNDSLLATMFVMDSLNFDLGAFLVEYFFILFIFIPIFLVAGIFGAVGGIATSLLKITYHNKKDIKLWAFAGLMVCLIGIGVYEIQGKEYAFLQPADSYPWMILLGIGTSGLVTPLIKNSNMLAHADLGLIASLVAITAILSTITGLIFPVFVGILGYLAASKKDSYKKFYSLFY